MTQRLSTVLVIATLLLSRHAGTEQVSSWDGGEIEIVAHRNGVPLQSYWKEPPRIVICDRVTAVWRVKAAVRFWENIGYSFGEVSEDPNPLSCYSDEFGVIKIQLPSTDEPMGNNMATTKTSRLVATGEALYSTIRIMPHEAGRKLILEHELGHAIGWMHTRSYGHIMHPEYVSVGDDTKGVRHNDYTVKIESLTNPTLSEN
tara:strand:- start:1429 stop:2034 length:606 start_codon:yes stop_codon:yes gene_type:complete